MGTVGIIRNFIRHLNPRNKSEISIVTALSCASEINNLFVDSRKGYLCIASPMIVCIVSVFPSER